jgi:hypothetical protein
MCKFRLMVGDPDVVQRFLGVEYGYYWRWRHLEQLLSGQVLHILFCFLVDVTVRLLCKRIVIGKSGALRALTV